MLGANDVEGRHVTSGGPCQSVSRQQFVMHGVSLSGGADGMIIMSRRPSVALRPHITLSHLHTQ